MFKLRLKVTLVSKKESNKHKPFIPPDYPEFVWIIHSSEREEGR
jgi:hypothetical protein